MRTLMSTLLLLVLLATAGCSSNPVPGQGGFAEHNESYNFNQHENNSNTHSPEHPMGLENALYFEQQLSQRHLDALLAAGANICFPASVKTAKIRQDRISRELQGGLDGDAANDLIIQRDQLTRLERRLNYVQMQDSCLPSESYKGDIPGNFANTDEKIAAPQSNKHVSPLSADQINQVTALLNNNNQFVINSAELNPRYVGQLSEATYLLRKHEQYHLKLTGHSDSKGNPADNLKLSLARAAQVERYLLIFGISPNNIQVTGSGSTQPFFTNNELNNRNIDKQQIKNDDAQARLINRRVSIELIDVNHSSEVTPK